MIFLKNSEKEFQNELIELKNLINSDSRELQNFSEKLLKKYFNDTVELAQIGQVLGENEKHHLSIMINERMIELDPGNSMTNSVLASELIIVGRNKEGFYFHDKSLQLEPNNIIFLYSKGDDLGKLGFIEEAIEYFNRVLRKEPTHSGALAQKAYCMAKLGDLDQAYELAEKSLKINPNDVQAQEVIRAIDAAE